MNRREWPDRVGAAAEAAKDSGGYSCGLRSHPLGDGDCQFCKNQDARWARETQERRRNVVEDRTTRESRKRNQINRLS